MLRVLEVIANLLLGIERSSNTLANFQNLVGYAAMTKGSGFVNVFDTLYS